MVALVDAIINLQICTKFNGGPDAALEDALDDRLNVAIEGHLRVHLESN